MPTIKAKTTHVFIPFERVERQEDGSAIVEGYAFVNEAVPGDRYRWKRSAVEAATPDYMRFGNVREMHQPITAGIVTEQRWDDRGWFLRSKVVDTEAAKKCVEGVYKGYSLGIRPLQLRGIEVEKLDVIETSLVDRPKDPDAVFTAYRAEGIDPEAEVECELLEERVADPPAADAPRFSADELAALEAQRAAAAAALTPPVDAPAAIERHITEDDGKWILWNHDKTKKLGSFDSKEEAEKREREIQYFKHEHAAEPEATRTDDKKWHPIREEDGKFCVYDHAGKKVGTFETKAEAEKRVRDMEYFKDHPEAAGKRAETSETVPVRENLEGKPKFMPREGMVTCQRCAGTGYVMPDGDHDTDGGRAAEPDPSLTRIAALEADNAALITRAESAEADFARVQGELKTREGELSQARERIIALEKMPAPSNRPVQFTAPALERDFFVNRANDRSNDLAAAYEKLAALQAQRPTDPGEQNALAAQVNLLKQQIAALA